MQLAGKWAAICSQRPGPKCTSTDVFRSKYGNGYDEEESLHDYTSGDYSCMFDDYFSLISPGVQLFTFLLILLC